MSGKILRNYVSSIDQFLQKFDKEHPFLSSSQNKEIQKHKKVYSLRDNEATLEKTKKIWEGF